MNIEDISIDDKKYKKHKKAYQYALDMLEKEIYQGCEALLHNLNSLQSRAGNQLPFSSINYGTCDLTEGRMFTKIILENTMKGTGKGATSIFPCQIFQLKDGINVKKTDKNYDLFQLAIKCTSKRMYPNYANCDWSNNDDSKSYELKRQYVKDLSNEQKQVLKDLISKDHILGQKIGLTETLEPVTDDPNAFFSTMGCRTANGHDINWFDSWKTAVDKIINGESVDYNFLATGQQKDGRGNICPATIILPTLAIEAVRKVKDDQNVVDVFLQILDKAITDCKDELIERYNWICAQDVRSASFMYNNGTMYGYIPEEGIKSALKHGTLAIGQIGLCETLKILIGTDHTSKRGMKVAKQIEQLFSDKCKEFKEEYKLNFGVYYTPAESLAFTSFRKFTEKYGLLEGITAYKDKDGNLQPYEYFTNSIHVNVRDKISPFEKIDIESELTGYSNAGCITYVEIGDNAMNNLKALEQIVLYAKKKDIPYFALNVRLSDCTKCGYSGYIDFDAPCPVCGVSHEYINDYMRITGYLSVKYSMWNKGKQAEGKDRYIHVNKLSNWKH